MKYKIKKIIMPLILIIIGIILVVFISVFKQEDERKDNIFYNKKYIKVKIKNKYPFPLLFKKGVSLISILKKFNLSAREIYKDKKQIPLNSKIYEDSTFQIS